MPLTKGQILNNRYSILKLLGQGGFGAVYRAWDINMDRPVALKENLDTTPQAQRQFYREAQILFDLSHPNLPKVMDHFVIPSQGQYLMMEYIEGQDLQEILYQLGGPLFEAQVLPWISQVCNALIYLHSQSPPIIHRDIKPANIKITPQGKAFLVDFGIAKIFDPKLRSASGASAVTPGYSPLEQYGQGTTDAQSDVYALGATLYHLLTGIQPPAIVDIVGKVFLPPRSPNSINTAISPRVSSAIEKAMQLEKQNRWSSVSEFKSTLTPPAPRQSPPSASLVGPHGTVVISEHQVSPTWQPSAPVAQRALPWGWLVAGGLALVTVILVGLLIRSILIDGKETPIPSPTSEVAVVLPSDTLAPTRPGSTSTEHPTVPATFTVTTPALPVDFIDEHSVKMKLIPAGEFQMGSKSGNDDEKPVHNVFLDAFYMDIYEVTNALYACCVEAGVCTEPSEWKSFSRDSYYGSVTFDNYPVIWVNWDQAREFCDWRGARLPSEAEWEKAARGGLEGKQYPWGDQEPDCSMANYSAIAGCKGDTTKIGSYPPNDFGLFDMSGNVFEWVWDWYSEDYYASSPSRNPRGLENGGNRVLRGGCWSLDAGVARVAFRGKDPTDFRNIDLGFRCARSLLHTTSLPSKPTETESPTLSNTSTTAAILQTDFTDEQGVKMKLIPAGEFQIGSESGRSDEKPVHTIYLDAFYVDVYEVTNALYRECVHTTLCKPPTDTRSRTRISYYINSSYNNYPVINVDWEQANTYCKWRDARLPTEAEWEKAARGLKTGSRYPWGDDEPDCTRANLSGLWCVGDTDIVGNYLANDYGLYDMIGNVAEWTLDWYSDAYYSDSPYKNPAGPSSGYHIIKRGGGWCCVPAVVWFSTAYRGGYGGSSDSTGFRCARTP